VIEMVRRFVRQKFGSPGLVVALAVLALVQTFGLAHGAGPSGFTVANWAIFVLAAGSVSRDVASGALQMILSRPIRRTQYLFGRYVGILVAFALFLVFTSLLAFIVVHLAAPGAAAEVSPARLAVLTGETFLSGAFPAAILLFFSTFLPGIADLLGLLILYMVVHLPGSAGSVLWRVAEAARENMVPDVSWNEALRGQGMALAAAGRWVFALTVYLALAAVVFSRRELPYGND
jgi:ABC-type transport system involved in multi-copper enzyme maturation permease subunit